MVSAASMDNVNESSSPGSPLMASGFPSACPSAEAAGEVNGAAGVHVCTSVSGLYWNTMTFGIGSRKADVNSTNAPRRYLPGISSAPPQSAVNTRGDSVRQNCILARWGESHPHQLRVRGQIVRERNMCQRRRDPLGQAP